MRFVFSFTGEPPHYLYSVAGARARVRGKVIFLLPGVLCFPPTLNPHARKRALRFDVCQKTACALPLICNFSFILTESFTALNSSFEDPFARPVRLSWRNASPSNIVSVALVLRFVKWAPLGCARMLPTASAPTRRADPSI